MFDEAHDGTEDVVPETAIGGQLVEDVGEGVQGEAGAVHGGGSDGFGEVFADAREELADILGLQDEIDEEIPGLDLSGEGASKVDNETACEEPYSDISLQHFVSNFLVLSCS